MHYLHRSEILATKRDHIQPAGDKKNGYLSAEVDLTFGLDFGDRKNFISIGCGLARWCSKTTQTSASFGIFPFFLGTAKAPVYERC